MNKSRFIIFSTIAIYAYAMASNSFAASPLRQSTQSKSQESLTLTAASSSNTHSFECTAGSQYRDVDGLPVSQSFAQLKNNGKIVFKTTIPLPDEDFYQNRASHCLIKDSFVYILDQVDTKSQQLSNQTLLYVIKLSKNGKILNREFINPQPKSNKRTSSFSTPEKENFTIDKNNSIHIKGKWKDINDHTGKIHSFSVSIPAF